MTSDLVWLVPELHHPPHRVAVVVLWTLLLVGVWAGMTEGWLPVLAVLAMAGLWLLTNSSMEGQVLLIVLPSHGVTQADLLSPLVVLSAVFVRLIRPRRPV